MCSCKTALGRQPTLYSYMPGQPGALCERQACHFLLYKSVNRERSFETILLR